VGSTQSRDVAGGYGLKSGDLSYACTLLKSHVLSALAAYLSPKRGAGLPTRFICRRKFHAGSNPRERMSRLLSRLLKSPVGGNAA